MCGRTLVMGVGLLVVSGVVPATQLRLEPDAVEISRADVVAVAEVFYAQNPCLRHPEVVFRPLRQLSGEPLGEQLTVRTPRSTDCWELNHAGPPPWRVGERAVLALQEIEGVWRILWAGGERNLQGVRRILARLPKWSDDVGGLRVRMTSHCFDLVNLSADAYFLHRIGEPQLDLCLLVKNVSGESREFVLHDPPRDGAFYLDLDVRDASDKRIPMRPLPDAEREATRRALTFSLRQGESTFLHLPPLRATDPMGRRPAYRFRYVALEPSKAYTIRATVHGLLPGRAIELEPLSVETPDGEWTSETSSPSE